MQRKTKIWIAACATAAVSVAAITGVAVADRGRHHGMGGPGDARAMLERYDANKDGAVSQEEIDTNRTQWHGEFDADKTGDLSLAEFQALWLKARRDMMVREFQEFDRDGDGKLTIDEYKAPLAMLVTRLDANNDGVLNRQDHRLRRGGGDDGTKGAQEAPESNS
ncbi:MAG TPA: EF-hand domain-containing protein [Aestuariivirgaceae bacterium]|nr:EF-hand domain-containing protein [Aestuariivirgaceae bacterium]